MWIWLKRFWRYKWYLTKFFWNMEHHSRRSIWRWWIRFIFLLASIGLYFDSFNKCSSFKSYCSNHGLSLWWNHGFCLRKKSPAIKFYDNKKRGNKTFLEYQKRKKRRKKKFIKKFSISRIPKRNTWNLESLSWINHYSC